MVIYDYYLQSLRSPDPTWHAKEEEKELLAPALRGIGEELLSLVIEGSDAKQWTKWLRAPLEHALAAGNIALAKKLLGAGADGSAGWSGARGRSLLLAAAEGGGEGAVRMMIDAGAGADVNVVKDFGIKYTPLHYAAHSNDIDTIRLLMKCGASADTRCTNGDTPLHMAARRDNAEAVLELLLLGANPNIGMPASSNETPLQGAFGQYAYGSVATLLEGGACANICDWDGTFLIHEAARIGSGYFMQLVLRSGGKVDVKDKDGQTPLHVAAASGNMDAIEYLLKARAPVGARDRDRETPLHTAARAGYAAIAERLLRAGSDVEARDAYGLTPLHACFTSTKIDAEDTVRVLLHSGADVNAADNVGDTVRDCFKLLPIEKIAGQPATSRAYQARVGSLLDQAVLDSAWRRRGWLVILRERECTTREDAAKRLLLRDSEKEENPSEQDTAGRCAGESNGGKKYLGFLADDGEEGVRLFGRVSDVCTTKRRRRDGQSSRKQFHVFGAYTVGLEQDGIFRNIISYL